MAPRALRRETAVAATLLAAVLWGTSFSVNDTGLRYVHPGAFVVLRFALAGLVVLGVAALARRLDWSLVRSPFLWGLAAMNALGFLLQYEGQTLTTPARTALFVNTSAFAVALLERFVLKQRLGLGRVLAIVAGVGGAALLVVGNDPWRTLTDVRLVGDLLTLGSGLAWSVYFVMNDRAVQKHDPLSVTAWTFTLSALVLLPALLLDPEPPRWSLPGAGAVLYAGLVTTALAYGLWTFGLRGIRPTTSAVLLLVEILVASLVSLALGRESFGLVELAGAALLVGAVLAMSFMPARAAST